MCMHEDSSGASATQAEKEEVDSRSIYVGNVRSNNPFLVSIEIEVFPIYDSISNLCVCFGFSILSIYIRIFNHLVGQKSILVGNISPFGFLLGFKVGATNFLARTSSLFQCLLAEKNNYFQLNF